MRSKVFALLGVLGILVTWLFIAVAIATSPWFSWKVNALSDLGHSVKSKAAPIYNFGLALGGLLLAFYAVMALTPRARASGVLMTIAAFALQLIAVYDEVYGRLHTVVSILFFIALTAASLAYSVEKRSKLALAAFVVSIAAWALYWNGTYRAGVAVPETVSALAGSAWVVKDVVESLVEHNRLAGSKGK